jgi:glucose/arabinose dehydrogenase
VHKNFFRRTLLTLLALCTAALAQYQLQEAFPNLVFEWPVDLQHSGDASHRLFVVEQAGRIRILPNSASATATKLFLDISDRVASGGEMGLLGLAFHPDYKNNGFFFVNYTRTNPRQTVISRFKVSADPDVVDKSSEQILLTIDQPYSNHNGGQTLFGPDGYLYIGLGDGGSGGDPQNNSQNLKSLLGKILRIDVNAAPADKAYAIPADNPFAGNTMGFREEIFAYGLRNPWRFSFDATGKLWCADVGQNSWEEINIIRKGGNYGWRIMEGLHCYLPSAGCDTTGLILPIFEYAHNAAGGYSITGGHIYYGSSVPQLQGRYLFADYVSHKIWSLGYYGPDPAKPIVEELTTAPAGISSFGKDESGELYICAFDGKIYKFKATATAVEQPTGLPTGYDLLQNHPNPFNAVTTIQYELPEEAQVRIELINSLGAIVAVLVEARQPGGRHRLAWDAGNYPAGIYLIRMEARARSGSQFRKTVKMVYLK